MPTKKHAGMTTKIKPRPSALRLSLSRAWLAPTALGLHNETVKGLSHAGIRQAAAGCGRPAGKV
jgi:hypothetical protein